MRTFVTKLIDLTQKNAEQITAQWAKDVKTNLRTYSYHNAPDDKIILQAKDFYTNFHEMFFHEAPFEKAEEFFEKYAEGVPLHEAVYALILMRRHIWLYAEFQSIFTMETEHRKAIESLSRTILMFDYIVYVIAREYWRLLKDNTPGKSSHS
ncbi:MAG TPA: hypothetical protein ENN23_05025 [Deltaproteobacteria bacterium]|nr:hypothetical protein [Deltaproteobacteria bacterium]